MSKKRKETPTMELAEILVQAILDEPYLNKDILIPKIKAIITGFRLDLSTVNYNKLETPTDLARLIRANEIQNSEVIFWKNELKAIVGDDKMMDYYLKRDESLAHFKSDIKLIS